MSRATGYRFNLPSINPSLGLGSGQGLPGGAAPGCTSPSHLSQPLYGYAPASCAPGKDATRTEVGSQLGGKRLVKLSHPCPVSWSGSRTPLTSRHRTHTAQSHRGPVRVGQAAGPEQFLSSSAWGVLAKLALTSVPLQGLRAVSTPLLCLAPRAWWQASLLLFIGEG